MFNCMYRVGLVLLILLVVNSQQEHDYNDLIQIECKGLKLPLYFKLMREFSLTLEYPQLKVGSTVQLSADNTLCRLNSEFTVCTFSGMVRQLDIKCDASVKMGLRVVRPEILGNTSKVQSSFVEIGGEQFQRGIISIEVKNDVEELIKRNIHETDLVKNVLTYSSCVKNAALFEEKFKLAIERSDEKCVIGLRDESIGRWSYKESPGVVGSQLNDMYKDFIDNNTVRVYRLPHLENYTMELIVENDDQDQVNNLQLNVSFADMRGSSVTYNLVNFQKGINPFNCQLFHNSPAMTLRFTANANTFITFWLTGTFSGEVTVEQEEYFFTKFEQNSTFALELDEFTEQQAKHRKIRLFTSPQAPKDVEFVYRQCQNRQCQKATPINIPPQTHEFQPSCTNLINKSYCFLKIQVKNGNGTVFGVLPHLPTKFIDLDLDKMHHGTLSKYSIMKFVLSKDKLESIKPDKIVVSVQGARLFITYDPSCRRVACAEFQIHQGSMNIPNQRSTMYLFLEGTTKTKYSFSLYTDSDEGFKLQNGILLQLEMRQNELKKFFTYQITDRTLPIQINCNGPVGQLQMLVNTKGKIFPTKQKHTHSSQVGFLYLTPADLQGSSDIIRITIRRISKKTEAKLQFSILAFSEGTPLQILFNRPFYDFFLPQKTKIFKFSQFVPALVKQEGLAIKIDIPDSVSLTKPQLTVKIGNLTDYMLNYTQWDISTIQIDSATMRKICTEPTADNICHFMMEITNPDQRQALHVQLLVWVKSQAIRLYDGKYINFDTGSLGTVTHLFFDIPVTSPINIYAFSSEVKMQLAVKLARLPVGIQPSNLNFPSLPVWSQKSTADLERLSPTFSEFGFLSPELVKTFMQARAQDTPNVPYTLLCLMSIRDYSNANKSDIVHYNTPKGTIQIVYTSGFISVREDDKLQYMLFKNDVMTFSFDISTILYSEEKIKQIFFHNIKINGDANSTISYFIQKGSTLPVTQIFKLPQNLQLVKVDFEQLTRGVTQQHGVSNNYSLIFKVLCTAGMSKYSSVIVSSESEYRQLALGLPEQFFIRKNSSAIFEFVDYYDQDFKIKINRKQGFPDYKIVSCKPQQPIKNCFDELAGKGPDDPERVVFAGRSHQLSINRHSEHYCQNCRYFIALFSHSQQIVGSLTVTGTDQRVMLIEGRSITTEVYREETDNYLVGLVPLTNAKLFIIPTSGKVNVRIWTKDDGAQKLTQVSEHLNVVNKSLEIVLTADDTEPIEKIIEVEGQQNSIYTIMYSGFGSNLILQDGLPITLQRKEEQITQFEYECRNDSTLVVLSNETLNVNVSCQVPYSLKLDQIVPVKQAANPDDNTSNQPEQTKSLTSSTAINQLSVQQSLLTNTSVVKLIASKCRKYVATVTSQKNSSYTIMASGVDFTYLPFRIALPGSLNKGSTKTYEMPVRERGLLKIVFRMCVSGKVKGGLTYDKADLNKQSDKFDDIFLINSDQDYMIYTYKAKPGILYMVLSSDSHNIDYSVQVVPVLRNQQGSGVDVTIDDRTIEVEMLGAFSATTKEESLQDKAKQVVSKILNPNSYEYELTFLPIRIQDNKEYKVFYYVVESLSKRALQSFARCRGLFANTLQEVKIYQQVAVPAMATKAYTANTQTKQVSPYLKINYKSNLPYSFATIIPIVTPQLPGYVTFETYRTVQLTGGSNSIWMSIKRFGGSIYYSWERNTGIQTQGILAFLTFLSVVTIIMAVLCFSCCMVSCIVYFVSQSSKYIGSRPLATSEFEGRQLNTTSNSLDMLDRPHEEQAHTQEVIGSIKPPVQVQNRQQLQKRIQAQLV